MSGTEMPRWVIDRTLTDHIDYVVSQQVAEGISKEEALEHFISSKTYELINDLDTDLIFEMSEYIYHLYQTELAERVKK